MPPPPPPPTAFRRSRASENRWCVKLGRRTTASRLRTRLEYVLIVAAHDISPKRSLRALLPSLGGSGFRGGGRSAIKRARRHFSSPVGSMLLKDKLRDLPRLSASVPADEKKTYPSRAERNRLVFGGAFGVISSSVTVTGSDTPSLFFLFRLSQGTQHKGSQPHITIPSHAYVQKSRLLGGYSMMEGENIR